MQRDIKFRVWNNKYKKFVFNLNFGEIQAANCNNGLLGVTFSKSGLETDEIKHKDCAVQQFTGLKDKKGKEIYEGDILCSPSDSNPEKGEGNDLVVVEWLTPCWIYRNVFAFNKQKYSIVDLLGFTDEDTEAEIIGNIFENPEFLEK